MAGNKALSEAAKAKKNENTDSEEEWLDWALRAFEATYGYEFQGDNVLIARVNLLMTFEEYPEPKRNPKKQTPKRRNKHGIRRKDRQHRPQG